MIDEDIDLDDIERRMKGAVEALKSEFAGIEGTGACICKPS